MEFCTLDTHSLDICILLATSITASDARPKRDRTSGVATGGPRWARPTLVFLLTIWFI